MNREAHLRADLPRWLALPFIAEVVVVDWSSKTDLRDFTGLDDRVRVLRVVDEPRDPSRHIPRHRACGRRAATEVTAEARAFATRVALQRLLNVPGDVCDRLDETTCREMLAARLRRR
jgi:hypothetical protein